MLILFGHPESGHSYKVALALALTNTPHEYRWVDVFAPRDQRAADFQAASRFGEIPVLVDDGIAFSQSNAILLHLAHKLARLGGESAERLALARERLFWEANRIGISLPNVRHYLRFAPGGAPEGALRWLRSRLQLDLASLDADLANRPFLLGDDVSVADLACAAYLLYDDTGLDLGTWPALSAWLKRIRGLPRFQPAATLLARN